LSDARGGHRGAVSESTIDGRRSAGTPVRGTRDRPSLRPPHERPSLRERVQPLADAWRPLAVTWAGLLIVVTAAGLLLVGPLDGGRIVRWDLHVERWFVDHRTSTLNSLAEAGTWLAETITVPVVLLIAIVIAWRVSSNVAAPAFLAVAVGGEKLLYLVSSLIVGRDRPPVPTVGTSYATSSFPSGHVASAITLYGSIALLIALRRTTAVRILLLAVPGAIAAVVAVCRMYAGFHFPSDCIAGVIVGIVWLTVTYHSVLRRTELAGGRPEGSRVGASAPGHGGAEGYRPPGKAAASTASA
jgi:membrane-associated phospholipid phosphatase